MMMTGMRYCLKLSDDFSLELVEQVAFYLCGDPSTCCTRAAIRGRSAVVQWKQIILIF